MVAKCPVEDVLVREGANRMGAATAPPPPEGTGDRVLFLRRLSKPLATGDKDASSSSLSL